MIIYATEIHFEPPTTVESILEAVASWLSTKLFRPIVAADLRKPGTQQVHKQTIEIFTNVVEQQMQHWAVRYTHPDRDVPGRRWETEVGFAVEQDVIRATVLLQTSEISARVAQSPVPSRPRVVNELLTQAIPNRITPGLVVKTLQVSHLPRLRDLLDSHDRHYPIVIVSPKADGTYTLDVSWLVQQIATLAEVYVIPPELDFDSRNRTLGPVYNAWDGTVKIIWPHPRYSPDWAKAKTRWYTPEDLVQITAEKKRQSEIEILEAITHRTNPLMLRHHISPSRVREAALRRELEQIRTAVDHDETTETYLKLLMELEGRIQESEAKVLSKSETIAVLESELSELEDQLRKEEHNSASLKMQLERVAYSRNGSFDTEYVSKMRGPIGSILAGKPSLVDGLQLIAAMFPNRVVVLDRAISSAEEAAQFERSEKAVHLLWKLATDYWDILVEGRGDGEARALFGDDFAATESETARKNQRAKELRTFIYRGEPVQMWPHLKIGVKPSIAQTWRAHFYWDAERQLIVIGHCGKHLDHE